MCADAFVQHAFRVCLHSVVEVFFDDPDVIGGLVDLQEVGVGSIAEHIARVRRAVSRMHDTGVVSESAERFTQTVT